MFSAHLGPVQGLCPDCLEGVFADVIGDAEARCVVSVMLPLKGRRGDQTKPSGTSPADTPLSTVPLKARGLRP
jgi:hypothetical protein